MQSIPDYQAKRKAVKAIFSLPVVLAITIVAGFTVKGAISSYHMHVEQDARYNAAVGDLNGLKTREDALREENDRLKTARGQEELFREQYMVAKEGENVMIITSDKKQGEEHSVTTETKEPSSLLDRTRHALSGN